MKIARILFVGRHYSHYLAIISGNFNYILILLFHHFTVNYMKAFTHIVKKYTIPIDWNIFPFFIQFFSFSFSFLGETWNNRRWILQILVIELIYYMYTCNMYGLKMFDCWISYIFENLIDHFEWHCLRNDVHLLEIW